MEAMLLKYGLLAVFIGGAVEGDATFILVGVVVHLGLLKLPAAIAAGTLGAFAGDYCWYWLGRSGSARIRNSKVYQRAEPLTDHLARRFGAWEIVLARFVFGARIASIVFWGIRGLPFARFVLLDLLGCLVWASGLITLGWWLSNSATLLLGEVRRIELWLLGLLSLSVMILLIIKLLLRRRIEAKSNRT